MVAYMYVSTWHTLYAKNVIYLLYSTVKWIRDRLAESHSGAWGNILV